MQPKTAILDFDDLCDTNDPYDAVCRLIERDSGFKVTLFAIPTRCSNHLLYKYGEIARYVQLAVHGWTHARHECLSWTSEETQDKLQKSCDIYHGFAHLFKAPNWEIDTETYAGCKAAGFAVADHIRNIDILPADLPNYIYNIRLRGDKYERLHGHIQPWAGTGLTEGANGSGINPKYLLPIGTPYAFCTDAIAPDKGMEI